MLKPSYAELMDVLNANKEGKDVSSRYTVVIAAAKRARQLIDGDTPMVENFNSGKPVSTAVEELLEDKIQIVGEGEGTVLNLPKKVDVKEEVKSELENVKAQNEENSENGETEEVEETNEFEDDIDMNFDEAEDEEEPAEMFDFDDEE